MSKLRFDELTPERELFLERGRKASELTLPLIIRPSRASSSTEYITPFQSVGSRGVTSLSSNLMLSLFPASTPFFRLLVSESDFDQFGEQSEQIREEVNTSLSKIEKAVLEEIEERNLRPIIFEVFKNLLIAGNSLVYVQPNGQIRNYTLEDYVVHRDVSGNILDIIVREYLSPLAVESLELKKALPSESTSKSREIELHTCIKLNEEGKYTIWQEVNGEKVKDTYSEVDKDKLPWLPLRLTKVTGESYGRGYVEGVIGDLQSLEALSQAVVEAAAITSKVVFMVNPGSTTRAKDLAEAKNGDVINGVASDVSTLQVNKSGDLSIALQASNKLEQRLSFAFNLLDATLPTNGATTATEINAIVNSLEKVLAGVFSMLASEFMQPLVRLIVGRLSDDKVIPELPKEVKLVISTGISSLGRTSDIDRITQFAGIAAQISPDAYAALTDFPSLLKQLESAIGVDALKSEQTIREETNQALAAQQAAQSVEDNASPEVPSIEQIL